MGSAESDDYDQLLDSVDVGPMQARTAPVCRRLGLAAHPCFCPAGSPPCRHRTLQTTAPCRHHTRLGPSGSSPSTQLTTITTVTTTSTITTITTITTVLSQVGPYKFVFQAEAPDPRRIPTHDILGVTVILLSCFYHEKVRARHVHGVCMACAWRVHGVCMARTLYAHRMHTACTPHARCVCRSSSETANTSTH